MSLSWNKSLVSVSVSGVFALSSVNVFHLRFLPSKPLLSQRGKNVKPARWKSFTALR